jgi:hypothetical protein
MIELAVLMKEYIMDINEFQDVINNCRECSNDDFIKEKIKFEKLKSFFGGSKIDVIILGHSPKVRTLKEAKYVLKMDLENYMK